MASPPWTDEYYRGNSVELFFDATNSNYLSVIDKYLLPTIEQHASQGQAIAGWFSLRFTGRSKGLLAMQGWDRTVSVEVSVLRRIDGSVEVLRALEKLALVNGGRIHWGQQNDLRAADVDAAYPDLPLWHAQLEKLVGEPIGRQTFANEFCEQRGLGAMVVRSSPVRPGPPTTRLETS
jgi:hypothetical protein